MPRRHRRIILAAGGCAILSGVAQSEDQRGHKGQHERADHQKLAAAPVIEPAASPDDARHHQPHCINDDGERQDCGSASAQATIDQARYARWQAMSGGVGIAIGLGTLIAAFGAAKWAKPAAKHTKAGALEAKRAADAAQDALKIPPDIYVTNAAVWKTGQSSAVPPSMVPGESIQTRIWVVNAGREDAIIRRGKAHCQVFWGGTNLPMERPYHGVDPGLALKANSSGDGVLRSGETDGWEMSGQVPATYTSAISLYLMGFVIYYDGFGKRRMVLFCRRYDPQRQTFTAVADYPDYEGREPRD